MGDTCRIRISRVFNLSQKQEANIKLKLYMPIPIYGAIIKTQKTSWRKLQEAVGRIAKVVKSAESRLYTRAKAVDSVGKSSWYWPNQTRQQKKCHMD